MDGGQVGLRQRAAPQRVVARARQPPQVAHHGAKATKGQWALRGTGVTDLRVRGGTRSTFEPGSLLSVASGGWEALSTARAPTCGVRVLARMSGCTLRLEGKRRQCCMAHL